MVALGWTLHDTLMCLGRYPSEDSKAVAAATFSQVGGPSPRALLAVQKWGGSCSLISAVGDDAPGALAIADLREAGVGTGAVHVDTFAATRLSHVWFANDTGSRTICYSSHGPALRPLNETSIQLLKDASILHLDGREVGVALNAIELARTSGALVSLDAGSPKPDLDILIQTVDMLIIPRATVLDITGRGEVKLAADDLLRRGTVKSVIVTLGVAGAYAADRSGSSHSVPSFPIDVVDSNGAGDVFAAALVWFYLQSQDLRRAVVRATAAAALKCAQLGNAGIPSVEAINGLATGYV
jgi:sulfofructose kinase